MFQPFALVSVGYYGRMKTSESLERLFGPRAAAELEQTHHRNLAAHGDRPRWLAALQGLPCTDRGWRVVAGRLEAGSDSSDPAALGERLAALIPWRKGPLRLGGVAIDTEWRSDWKWDRIAPHVDLLNQRVLDVGCGNGYFGWRMLGAGAARVIGCDPTPLFVAQHEVISHFAGPADHRVLALRLEDLPPAIDGFDTVFSLGVLYHRRQPHDHLQRLKAQLAPGGQVVLETLIIPGSGDDELVPPGRYANMRNVHQLPTATRLLRWLETAGFTDARIVDSTPTTTGEQRTTDWMPFHSLAEALSADGKFTTEGHPPPLRATLVAAARQN